MIPPILSITVDGRDYRVGVANECWFLLDIKDTKDGYPRLSRARCGKRYRNTFAREIIGLKPGDPRFACHHCLPREQRWCVRHVHVGTHRENMRDLRARGAASRTPLHELQRTYALSLMVGMKTVAEHQGITEQAVFYRVEAFLRRQAEGRYSYPVCRDGWVRAKGRQRWQKLHGPHPRYQPPPPPPKPRRGRKLTPPDVRAIKLQLAVPDRPSFAVIGRDWGVSEALIKHINSGRRWAHVSLPT